MEFHGGWVLELQEGFKAVRRYPCCSLEVDYKRYRRCCKDSYWIRSKSKNGAVLLILEVDIHRLLELMHEALIYETGSST
ncbi:hypothetical protein GBA52_018493 [Prunus armeniaca]|nr:hypothetical protein GBA52_018493 [Prunus armeniaca]